MNNLYNTDYHQWLSQQVTLLKTQNFNQLDLENLIEDLELSIKQDLRVLDSHLVILILHLLKIDYQTSVLRDSIATERVLKGWVVSICNARRDIDKLIEKNHCLTAKIEEVLSEAYPDAKERAVKEMNIYASSETQRLNDSSFPPECPWSFEQIMTEDWYPLNGVNLYDRRLAAGG
ncbi:DUF29 domain-containing protein [Endozoicomonas sp. ALD040]|uniref:DUF29 domain-containing protein n=2 Tax=Endozoicomonas TaxID=305899 RepID=UPI003BAF674D